MPDIPSQNKKGKRKGRKRAQDKWDSEEEDESDQSEFPPCIMKVMTTRALWLVFLS